MLHKYDHYVKYEGMIIMCIEHHCQNSECCCQHDSSTHRSKQMSHEWRFRVFCLIVTPEFCLFPNLKTPIIEICLSAQESANFHHIIDFLKIFVTDQKSPEEKNKVIIWLFNLLADIEPFSGSQVRMIDEDSQVWTV